MQLKFLTRDWRQAILLHKFSFFLQVTHKNMSFTITECNEWTFQGLIVRYRLGKHFLVDLHLRAFAFN